MAIKTPAVISCSLLMMREVKARAAATMNAAPANSFSYRLTLLTRKS